MILRSNAVPAGILTLVAVISAAAQPVRFAIVGDRNGDEVPAVYECMVRELAMLRPDFAVNVGDTINHRGVRPPAEQWAAIERLWQEDRFPWYATPGNHDIYSPETEALFIRETGHQPFYSFTNGAVHVVVLDNSRTPEPEPAQMRFLEDDLKRTSGSRGVTLVVFHKPFWLKRLEANDSSFLLHRLARQYHITAVVSGHGHCFLYRAVDGIAYIEAGSSGAGISAEGLANGFARGKFYGFIWAVADGGHLRLSVRELGPPYGQGRLFPIEDLPASPGGN